MPPEPLGKTHRTKLDVPCFLAASAVFLVLGLFLPVITLKELVFWKSTFSVVTGIWSLFQEGHWILGVIIFLFSIVFPIVKLSILSLVWCAALGEEQRRRFLHWLAVSGKWSMLDVFVVALTIVITKVSKLAKAEPRIGIYFFAVSILLAMLVTERVERLMRRGPETVAPVPPEEGSERSEELST